VPEVAVPIAGPRTFNPPTVDRLMDEFAKHPNEY